jgi:3-polyprenyl-4-hydroxybenzoate decarboxylase
MKDFESGHFAYFKTVCAPEFLLYFEDPSWETTVLQAAYVEPCIYHATVAIGALSRSRYHPQSSQSSPFPPDAAFVFSMKQYNLAIQAFSTRLDDSARSCELALLGSLVFIALKVLIGCDNQVLVHLRSAFALLQSHTS